MSPRSAEAAEAGEHAQSKVLASLLLAQQTGTEVGERFLDVARTIALIRIADALERIDEGMAMHVEDSLGTIATALESIEPRIGSTR